MSIHAAVRKLVSLIIFSAPFSSTFAAGLELHVSPSAPSGGDGSPEKPLRSLEQARDRLRADRVAGQPATVWLHGGDHVLERSLVLTRQDGGVADAPVRYRARPDAKVRLLGARRLKGWRPVSDPEINRRLPAGARGNVAELDLARAGIDDFGKLKSRGFKRSGATPAALELMFNGEIMPLARWPNRGEFAEIAGYPKEHERKLSNKSRVGGLEGGFHYDDPRPASWKRPEKVWMHGYWTHDWADTHEQIQRLDPETRLIETRPPHGEYGYKPGQRYYYYNILEELDEPGEWFLDRGTGMLYFWPPAPLSNADVLVSQLDTPLVEFRQASSLRLEEVEIVGGRAEAILITGGENVVVDSCVIRNPGTFGIRIHGGRSHQVRGCEVSHSGEAAIDLNGGDLETLEPGNHLVIGNHLHHMGRWSRSYRPGVALRGVGNRIAHNLIHHGPHSAINFGGVDQVIEFNEIHSVCRESGDVGAIYTGRSWTNRGNVIRHNHIHHLSGRGGHGSMAIYLDDLASGFTIFGNVIHDAQHGVYVGGGRDNRVENNLLFNMERYPLHIDARGHHPLPHWRNMIQAHIKSRLYNRLENAPVYARRFPDLLEIKRLYEEAEGFIGPEGTAFVRNVVVDDKPIHIKPNEEELVRRMVRIEDNLVGVDPLVVDVEKGVFDFREASPARDIGFQPIPHEKIGLDGYRNP